MKVNFKDFVHTVSVVTAKFCVVFCIVVGVMLTMQYKRMRSAQPLDAPELQSLREQFANEPSDSLREKVRQLDFIYRRAWFTGQEQFDWGLWILAGSGTLLLISLQLVSITSDKKIKKPTGKADEGFTRKSLVRKIIATGVGGLCVGVIGYSVWNDDADSEAVVKVVPLPTVAEMKSNWVAFRGYACLGEGADHKLPMEWSDDNLKWKKKVDTSGFSSPLIWKDKLILTGGDKNRRTVSCYNAITGELIWVHEVSGIVGTPVKPPKVSDDTGFAAATPTTDGRYIYAAFATGDLVCVDFDGKMVWGKNLGVPQNPYGYSSSLLIADNKLVVQYDDEKKQVLYAMATETGHVLWQTDRESEIGWSSPSCIDIADRKLVVLLTCAAVEGFDLHTGMRLWSNECMRGEVAPSISFSDGKIFVANDNACAAALDPLSGKVIWKNEDVDLPDVSSPICVDGMVYLFTSGGVIVCLDGKTGEMLWDHETDEGFYSSAIYVDGKIVVIDMAGIGYIIEPNREKYIEVGRHDLGEGMVATPAFGNGCMYLRGLKNLFCIESSEVVK